MSNKIQESWVALNPSYQLQTSNLVHFIVSAVFEITVDAQLSFDKLRQKALEASKIIFKVN